ncbi:riboflavin biosynthesis protein RibD [Campylobacterota bacterium]|nr:riboflavin biosynthesis protein RibD [Campylobacterota bacterium]
MINDEFYMSLALKEGWRYQCLTYPNPAVGAALLDRNGRLIAVAAHKKAGGAHAEVEAFREGFLAVSPSGEACEKLRTITSAAEVVDFLRTHHNGVFKGATLFVTLEPCASEGKTPACAPLVADLGVSRLVYGTLDPTPKMGGGAEFLRNRKVAVKALVLQGECDRLLAPFLMWQKGSFVLFKWASRLSGTIDGGTISGDLAHDETHRMRSIADLLVVGGNTVRTDRPTLDARRVKGRAPNLAILSKHGDFDSAIPLFGVADRKVTIEQELPRVHGFTLIEGGNKLLNALWQRIDWLLCYQSVSLQSGECTMKCDRQTKMIWADRLGDDARIWLSAHQDPFSHGDTHE